MYRWYCIQEYSKYNELGLAADGPKVDNIQRIIPICVPSQIALIQCPISHSYHPKMLDTSNGSTAKTGV